MKDLCQKMEGKTNISRRLKQFDGLTWLTPHAPLFYDRSTPLARWLRIRDFFEELFLPLWDHHEYIFYIQPGYAAVATTIRYFYSTAIRQHDNRRLQWGKWGAVAVAADDSFVCPLFF